MTEQFINFFIERAKFSDESWINLVQKFGKLSPPQFEDNGELQDLINCTNNPLVFIDKLYINKNQRVDINIGFYTLMQKFNQRKNILYTSPEDTGKSMFIAGYALYNLLFTNKHVKINTSCPENILGLLKEFYDNLPEHLKVKSKEEVFEDKSSDGRSIDLMIFDDITLDRAQDELSKDIPTIIMVRNSKVQGYKDWLIEHKDEEGLYKYNGLTFSFQDLGFGYEYFKEKYEAIPDHTDKAKELYNRIF